METTSKAFRVYRAANLDSVALRKAGNRTSTIFTAFEVHVYTQLHMFYANTTYYPIDSEAPSGMLCRIYCIEGVEFRFKPFQPRFLSELMGATQKRKP